VSSATLTAIGSEQDELKRAVALLMNYSNKGDVVTCEQASDLHRAA
jgi:hypothetical protein